MKFAIVTLAVIFNVTLVVMYSRSLVGGAAPEKKAAAVPVAERSASSPYRPSQPEKAKAAPARHVVTSAAATRDAGTVATREGKEVLEAVQSGDGEVAEFLVECDEDAGLGGDLVEDFFARVPRQVPRPGDIESGGGEGVTCAAPHAAIEQQLHAARCAGSGSTCSCATARRAKTMQARMSSISSQGYPARMVSGESSAPSIP
jgi:hypothetical protein